jgi:hypothetical protein
VPHKAQHLRVHMQQGGHVHVSLSSQTGTQHSQVDGMHPHMSGAPHPAAKALRVVLNVNMYGVV